MSDEPIMKKHLKKKWRKEKKLPKMMMNTWQTREDTSDAPSGGNIDDMDFGKAFKHWRGKGVDTFTWRGKKYTTKQKGE